MIAAILAAILAAISGPATAHAPAERMTPPPLLIGEWTPTADIAPPRQLDIQMVPYVDAVTGPPRARCEHMAGQLDPWTLVCHDVDY